MLEATGRVVHPAVSSVLYLSGGGDPTLVLDEALDGPPASAAWLVHPQRGAFMTFPGELLHGVVPTACATAPQPRQRLTLLIAWYSEATQRAAPRTQRLGPQSAMPRCTRSTMWPATLQCPPQAAPPAWVAAAIAARDTPAATRLHVPEASPAWAEIAPGEASDSARLEVPPALQQHFFLRRPDDVRARLFEEHGLGGSWAAEAAPARKAKRSRGA